MAAQLTKRDLEIFDVLTKRLRVLSLPQIARTWWPTSADAARVAENRLRTLAQEKLLHIEQAPAHPELAFESAACSWDLTEPDPDFGALSYRLQTRWAAHPVLTTCVSATTLSASRFGGHGGRPPRSVERTHDLHMARVFLLYRERTPEKIKTWVFEERIKSERRLARRRPEHGEKLPDVLLRTADGVRVVEFGGAYGKDKLISFHRYCKENKFPYEIW